MDISKKFLLIALACVVLSIAISTGATAADDYDWESWDETGADEGLLGGLMCLSGAACILPVIMFIIWIVLAIWVYKDAEKRGKSGALWLIIVIITGIIGLIIWLVIRPPIGGEPGQNPAGADRRCPSCGRQIPVDAQVCPYCGNDFKK